MYLKGFVSYFEVKFISLYKVTMPYAYNNFIFCQATRAPLLQLFIWV